MSTPQSRGNVIQFPKVVPPASSAKENRWTGPLKSSAVYNQIYETLKASHERPAKPPTSGSSRVSSSRLYTTKMEDSISRSEFSAELNAIRADMRASQAEMRADFASMQKNVIEAISKVAEATAETRGSIDGLKSSIGMLQFIITVVAAIVGIWIAYLQLSSAPTPSQPQISQPIVIQVPSPAVSTPATK